MPEDEVIKYTPVPTLQRFHNSGAQIRCIVGPVGSSKTTGATMEVCYYLPFFVLERYKIKKTRFVIIRNTYAELIDTTQKTVFEWFPFGKHQVQRQVYVIKYPNGVEVELLFRSCDRPEDVKKFKSLEVTGYWIDESIEVPNDVKKMLKNRIGRYPRKSPVRFGIETTNPPDVEHLTYSEFAWETPPPGPIPSGKPKKNHVGFWQPPRENEKNLRDNYYDDLINDYEDSPDWISMYVKGKPGVIIQGKLVYNNFYREYHQAKESLTWNPNMRMFRGWDDSGNTPACIVLGVPSAGMVHVFKEFCAEKKNIVDFAKDVAMQCNVAFPDAKWTDYDDPAGWNKFSRKEGGFTSNAVLIQEAIKIRMLPSDQNLTARLNAVDLQLGKINGMLIDPSCVRLLNGFLGGYAYKELGQGYFAKNPMKNRFSHIQDALQYVLIRITQSQVYEENNELIFDNDTITEGTGY